MSDPQQDKGTGHHQSEETTVNMRLTYGKALGGASGGAMRYYAEIIALQKTQRNVLELKIKRQLIINNTTIEPNKL